ncbi:MAG: cytochrome c peroxidase [Campylobacterota bacterium]|nr:cytochrome c peroxidase [Campylobacterota bacterium]
MRIIQAIFIATVCITYSIAEVITPIPFKIEYDKSKAVLGKKLFSDTRLSKDDTVSCASCHILQSGGDGDMQYSFGIDGQIGVLNSPTVLNAVFNFSQMMDGAAKDLNNQIHFPITNPIEMGTNYEDIISKLKKDKEYQDLFKKNYDQGINKESINDAITQFQSALITPNSRFDQYLRGDKSALSEEELEGFNLFKKNGCTACHNGVNIGSNLYQRVGILKPYVHDESDTTHELGRYNVTKKEHDKYLIKVPTLRNIELTAPYLHNGKMKTLKSAVDFMLRYQVGIKPDNEDTQKIVKFLKTLTGDTPHILRQYNEKK